MMPAAPVRRELRRISLLETVWKLRTGSISWSHEAAQRGEIAHFSALGVNEKRLIRPVQILSRQSLETVWKLLRTYQPPQHKPRHRRIDERLSGGAQPLVVLRHSTVVRDPGERSLYDPPTWQDLEASGQHQALPVHLLDLLGPLLCPDLSHLFRYRLRGLAHH